MLAPQDPPTNASTSGHSSSNAPMACHESHHFDASLRPSTTTAASPQYIDEYAVAPSQTSEHPYLPSSIICHPQVQSTECSPSINNMDANSQENLYSRGVSAPPSPGSKYTLPSIPPPSPTSNHACLVPESMSAYTYGNIYPSKAAIDPYQQQYQQHSYQVEDPYQQTRNPQQRQQQQRQSYSQPYVQKQPYPDPNVQVYPELHLVDTIVKAERAPLSPSSGPASVSQPGRRRKTLWIGAIVIVALIGVVIALVIVMKNKNSDENGNSTNNSTFGNNTTRTTTTAIRSTTTAIRSTTSTSSITVPTTPISPIPVTVPTPGPSTGNRATAPPLPALPPQGKCPDSFCNDYVWPCRENICAHDSEFKTCKAQCNGSSYCERIQCENNNSCFQGCRDNMFTCLAHCR